jgi:hypothetical protein
LLSRKSSAASTALWVLTVLLSCVDDGAFLISKLFLLILQAGKRCNDFI